jgi:hypothetical protein
MTVNGLFSKLKPAEVDRGMTAKIEGPTESHSLALIGGSKIKTNANPSTRMFSLSYLMSMPDEEFDVLREDELALLPRWFERLHQNRVNMRRNTTCFKCGKAGHFFAECPKENNHDKHKFKDKQKKSEKKDHGHGKKMRSREKMKRSSDVESDSEDTSSSLSEEEEEEGEGGEEEEEEGEEGEEEEGGGEEEEAEEEEARQVSQRPLYDGPKPQGRLLWHGS